MGCGTKRLDRSSTWRPHPVQPDSMHTPTGERMAKGEGFHQPRHMGRIECTQRVMCIQDPISKPRKRRFTTTPLCQCCTLALEGLEERLARRAERRENMCDTIAKQSKLISKALGLSRDFQRCIGATNIRELSACYLRDRFQCN